jgi:CRP/FNR family nitrogen fixation transcriptional regulator
MLQQQIRISRSLPPPLMSLAESAPRTAAGPRSGEHSGLEASGERVVVRAGQAIYADGEPATYCYKLVSGGARIVKLISDGRREICEFAVAGDYLGLEAGLTHGCSAEAVVHSVLLRYHRRDVDAILKQNAASAFKVCQILARAVESSRKRAAYLCRMSADERVACFLLDLADRLPDPEDDEIELPMARSDIADYLGLATETISRVLTRLKNQGVIALEGTRGVRLLDREFLVGAHGGL